MVENEFRDKNGTMISDSVSVKNQLKYWLCEENYVWYPSKCACKCDKFCVFGEYLKECECLVDGAVVAYNETEDTPKCVVINPSVGILQWLIAVILLGINLCYC